MFFNRNPVKKAAYKLFDTHRSDLLVGLLDNIRVHTKATEKVYEIAYSYCTENDLHLSTIHAFKEHFTKWSAREIDAGISIVM